MMQAVDESPVPTRGDTVAETMVLALSRLGVEVIFLNPGTDTAPIQEGVARLCQAGLDVPRVVLCPHESVALAAATAYYAVTHRPQVVMVHVDVGTQNLGAMMHNALRSEAAVLVIAGRTPVTSHGELPGGRDHTVHWEQDVPDQAGIVRGYARWCGEVHAPEVLERQLARALQVAASAPCGPAYLTLPRETLMSPAPEPRNGRSVRAVVPTRMFPAAGAVREVARRLAECRRPLIITSRLGRDTGAVQHLVDLVEITGARVIDRRERMNFPSGHRALVHSEGASRDALRSADVVLVVDDPVPWVPLHAAPAASAFVALVDRDPVHSSMPGWNFDVDLPVQADPGAFLELVCAALREGAPGGGGEPRREQGWAGFGDEVDDAPPGVGADDGDALPPSVVARALDAVLAPEDILITEATTNAGVLRQHVARTVPGTAFHPGGSGLGWALGAAVGSRLAAPDRRVIAVLGDGSFLFANPLAALWTAKSADAAFLALILENGGYAASRKPVFDLFPDGVSSRTHEVVGTRFVEAPDLAALGRAYGGYGARAQTRDELGAVLDDALGAVADGHCAVVCVPVSSPWFPARSGSA